MKDVFNLVFEKLGPVDAERFLMLLSRERQDVNYTEWRRSFWMDQSLDKLIETSINLEQKALSRKSITSK